MPWKNIPLNVQVELQFDTTMCIMVEEMICSGVMVEVTDEASDLKCLTDLIKCYQYVRATINFLEYSFETLSLLRDCFSTGFDVTVENFVIFLNMKLENARDCPQQINKRYISLHNLHYVTSRKDFLTDSEKYLKKRQSNHSYGEETKENNGQNSKPVYRQIPSSSYMLWMMKN